MRQLIQNGPGHEDRGDHTTEEVSNNAAASKQTASHVRSSLLHATKSQRHDEWTLSIGVGSIHRVVAAGAMDTTHSTTERSPEAADGWLSDDATSAHVSRPWTPYGIRRTRLADGSTFTSMKL